LQRPRKQRIAAAAEKPVIPATDGERLREFHPALRSLHHFEKRVD
jgi:hypothetical protein